MPELKLSESSRPFNVAVTGMVWGDPDAPDAVIVMVALLVPITSPAVFTDTVTELGAVPEAGESVSQEALLVAVQERVPAPEFVIDSDWEAGFPCPWNAENERLVGLTASVGGASVNVTGTLTGELDAPAALKTIVAVYVPCARPEMFTAAVTLPEFVPLVGVTVSHDADSLTVQFRLPPPALLTAIVCEAGLLPPGVATYDSEELLSEKAGGATLGTDTVLPLVKPGTLISAPLSLP